MNIAVLISGSGTNLQALIDTAALGAEIVLVLSDRGRVAGLARAEPLEMGVEGVEPSTALRCGGLEGAVEG